MSRAVTISARSKGSRSHFTVGRVVTPTLALVVHREQEISNFVPVKHFKPWIDLSSTPEFRAYWAKKDGDPRVDDQGLLSNIDFANNIISSTSSQAKVTSYQTSPGSQNAPLPFSLSALQSHCSKLFGFKGVHTLEVAESLYLKKIISYPRASSDLLPESMHSDAPGILTSLAKTPLPTAFISALRGAKVSIKSKAFDDEVEKHGHHAIIPLQLDNHAIISTLTPDETKLYLEVVKRYILQFWPSAKFLETKIELISGGDNFVASGRRYLDEGWRKAFALNTDENLENKETEIVSLPNLNVGDILTVQDKGLDSAVTKPPKRFTEGTLLEAMTNVHRFVLDPGIKSRLKESAGIGTEATRAEMIKKLFDNGFIENAGKEIVPTANGTKLINVLPRAMTAPDMTALWESFLESLMNGNTSYQAFIERQKAWLTDLVKSSVSFFDGVDFSNEPAGKGLEVVDTEFKCTSCNSMLRRINGKNGWFFGCSNASCKKTFVDKAGTPVERVLLPDSGIECPQCKKHFLVRRERTDKTAFFWTCKGWRPDKKGCNAIFSDVNGAPDFGKISKSAPAKLSDSVTDKSISPRSREDTHAEIISCPQCAKGHLIRVARKAPNTGYFWSCNLWRDGCKASFRDENGTPVMNTSSSQTRATPAPAPLLPQKNEKEPVLAGYGKESGNRFLNSLGARGMFGGKESS